MMVSSELSGTQASSWENEPQAGGAGILPAMSAKREKR
jgi:hypothetical protein